MKLKRSGFSFVEIMMVVFMLCICVLPLMGYIQGNTRATAHTMDRSLGMTIVSQTMERFRNLSYDELNTLTGGTGSGKIGEPELANDPLLRFDTLPQDLRQRLETDKYQREVAFEDIPDPRVTGPAAATAKVGLLTVTVSWKPVNLSGAKMSLSKIITSRQP